MKRATHNLGNYRVTAGDLGKLYPFGCVEVLPGDTFRCSSQALIRMQPLMTPLMHPLRVSISHWFVPTRIIWNDFEDFITQKKQVAMPTIPAANITDDTVPDYMGFPPSGLDDISALPVRAFNRIFNEFFGDQDLSAEREEDEVSIPFAAWEKDYFTTARPQPQQGEAVSVPLSGVGRIIAQNASLPRDTPLTIQAESTPSDGYYQSSAGGQLDAMIVNLASGQINIEDWRKAMALQRFAEARSKFGSRYKDLLAYLGVNSPDGRLDRPEYLGGGRQTISFSEVLQSVEAQDTPLGTQGGHGIGAINTRPWRRMFTEHGYMISLVTLRPKAIYLTARDRMWVRKEPTDYWRKEDQILGDQAVPVREVYAGGDTTNFGYAPRHDDYRSLRSLATGPMRRSAYNTWHMAREFQAQPALNESFINCDPTKRVLRSSNDPAFYTMIQNRLVARRLVSKHARV